MYLNFLTLHVAIRILSCAIYVEQPHYVDYAQELLLHFVKSFQIIYGKGKVSHNVHNLLHICDDVKKFGKLDNFSAFKFENYMSTIKRVLRKMKHPCNNYLTDMQKSNYVPINLLRKMQLYAWNTIKDH